MTTAAELRAEAQQLREKAEGVTDPAVLAEMQALIEELEELARQSDNGDARDGALVSEAVLPSVPRQIHRIF